MTHGNLDRPAAGLTINPEKVCFIIVKAREFDAKEAVIEPEPGSNPTDDADVEILEDYPDDPTLQELVGAIEGLNEDEQAELVALAWLGRGDFEQGVAERGQAGARAPHRHDRPLPRRHPRARGLSRGRAGAVRQVL